MSGHVNKQNMKFWGSVHYICSAYKSLVKLLLTSCLVSKKLCKPLVFKYVFGFAMQPLILELFKFKAVKVLALRKIQCFAWRGEQGAFGDASHEGIVLKWRSFGDKARKKDHLGKNYIFQSKIKVLFSNSGKFRGWECFFFFYSCQPKTFLKEKRCNLKVHFFIYLFIYSNIYVIVFYVFFIIILSKILYRVVSQQVNKSN